MSTFHEEEVEVGLHITRSVWFHAASAGELESLAPVALEWAKRGRPIFLSVFSPSGIPQLKRLVERIHSTTGVRPPSGYSPPEGMWGDAFKKARPAAFVTVKYEAWPELWGSLSAEGIPLFVIGARARPSFLWVKRLLMVLGVPLPALGLFTVHEAETFALSSLFRSANVACLGEPRWDQVFERVQQGNLRAGDLLRQFQDLPRPWGVLAQTWPEDLSAWRAHLRDIPGTLWVVPHQVNERSVRLTEEALFNADLHGLRSRGSESQGVFPALGNLSPRHRKAVLVNEIGILAELYSAMDWCYVGGGFGEGIHSTIEPALQGLPLCAGPHGASKFSEIEALCGTGQLSLVEDSSAIGQWLKNGVPFDQSRKIQWKADAAFRRGATQRVVCALERAFLAQIAR